MVTRHFAKIERGSRIAVASVLLAQLALFGIAPGEVYGQSDPVQVTVFGPTGKQSIPISLFADVPMVPLDEIAPLIGGQIRAEAESAVLQVGERSVAVYSGRSLALLEGNNKLLSDPVTVRGGRWFVPLDFLGSVLPILTEDKTSYRERERILVLGEGFPHLQIRTMAYPNYTRIVIQPSVAIPLQVNQSGSQVQVLVQSPYVETDFRNQDVRDGVVERIYLSRMGESYLLTIELGERFGTMNPFELENPNRLVLDLFRSRLLPGAEEEMELPEEGEELPELTPRPVTPPRPEPPDVEDLPPGELRIITLDPGHGGAETGAEGPSGLLEKDVTLSIARRLRTLLESRLGIQVVFTRDGDRNLPLDERTAVANNNKSDLFLSIHVNASPRSNARGSSVYFLSYEATDEESRRVAAAENAPYRPLPNEEERDLQFILWDMAQSAYLNESAVFAEILQEELLGDAGERNNRGIKQAPFRVLMGATMPAVLIEVAFITNAEEERLLRTSDFQNRLAEAIYRGIVRYKARYERRLGMGGGPSTREAR
jgi:N-acetylmuramoyl-L-alanine amidase